MSYIAWTIHSSVCLRPRAFHWPLCSGLVSGRFCNKTTSPSSNWCRFFGCLGNLFFFSKKKRESTLESCQRFEWLYGVYSNPKTSHLLFFPHISQFPWRFQFCWITWCSKFHSGLKMGTGFRELCCVDNKFTWQLSTQLDPCEQVKVGHFFRKGDNSQMCFLHPCACMFGLNLALFCVINQAVWEGTELWQSQWKTLH